jgi:hypothetical protein
MALLARSKGDLFRFSEVFPDANVPLADSARRGLEGIVGTQKDACRSRLF